MGMLGKVKSNEVEVRLEAFNHLVLGEPKTGKTTLFYDLIKENYNGDFSKALLIACEQGYKALDGIHAVDINDWDELSSLVDELTEDREEHGYKMVCIDTIDALVEMAVAETLASSKKKDGKKVDSILASHGGFNRGKEVLFKLINELLGKLEKGSIGIMMLGHTKLKKKNTGVEGEDFMELSSNLTNDYEVLFTKRADLMVYLSVQRRVDTEIEDVKKRTSQSKVNMVFRSNGTSSGCRFKDMPEMLPYSAKNYLKAFEQGVKGSLLVPKTDEEMIETAKKQEKKAIETAKEIFKQKTIEEMVSVIKENFSQLGDGAKTKLAELIQESGKANIPSLTEEDRKYVEEMYDIAK